jgi:hypothetical protein
MLAIRLTSIGARARLPGNIEKVLHRFHPDGIRGTASPMPCTPPTYGSTTSQLVAVPDSSPPCTASEQLFLQQLIGCLLYYARALDHTFLTAVYVQWVRSHRPKPRLRRMLSCLLPIASSLTPLIVLTPSSCSKTATWSCIPILTDRTFPVLMAPARRFHGYQRRYPC